MARKRNWISPVPWDISYNYGVQDSGYEAGYHTGIDFGVPHSTPVHSVQKGRVVEAGWNDSYGNYVKVVHPNGYYSLYAHLSKSKARVGQRVGQGHVIGQTGESGNANGSHLHFEIRSNSNYGSDIDPRQFVSPNAVANNKGGGSNGGGGGGGMGNNGGGNNGGGGNKDQDPNYGFVDAFLDEHPEIRNLVEKARRMGYTDERFAAELKDTRWWQNKTEAQRQWDILSTEQPKEAKRRIEEVKEDIQTTASSLGVNLGNKELNNLAERFAMKQSSANEMAAVIGARFRIKKDTAVVGQGGIAVDELRAMAADFGVKVHNQQLEKWTRDILQGDQTVEGLTDRIREQAKILHPTIAKYLDEGQTTRDVMEPYMNIAAEELGIPPSQMNLVDSKWLKALRGEDGGPMTMDEWSYTLRNGKDFNFDGTKRALAMSANLTTQLAQAMGAKG